MHFVNDVSALCQRNPTLNQREIRARGRGGGRGRLRIASIMLSLMNANMEIHNLSILFLQIHIFAAI